MFETEFIRHKNYLERAPNYCSDFCNEINGKFVLDFLLQPNFDFVTSHLLGIFFSFKIEKKNCSRTKKVLLF